MEKKREQKRGLKYNRGKDYDTTLHTIWKDINRGGYTHTHIHIDKRINLWIAFGQLTQLEWDKAIQIIKVTWWV